MTPGPVEEGGKTVRKLIGNLHESPLTLALVLFNLIFVLVIFLGVRDNRARQETFQNKLFEQQNRSMEMLYNCTPNRRSSDG
jgi:hypothetical protein